jgi:hypothetical protein
VIVSGEVAEWSKAVDSKSIVGQPTAGSNPALSATSLGMQFEFLWRDDRVDEGARLERECAATYRGFESHSLRHFSAIVRGPWWWSGPRGRGSVNPARTGR